MIRESSVYLLRKKIWAMMKIADEIQQGIFRQANNAREVEINYDELLANFDKELKFMKIQLNTIKKENSYKLR